MGTVLVVDKWAAKLTSGNNGTDPSSYRSCATDLSVHDVGSVVHQSSLGGHVTGQRYANTHYVMVLEDGETYTILEGCKIVALDANGIKTYEQDEDTVVSSTYIRASTEFGHVVAEFTRDGMTTVNADGVTVTFK